MNKLYTFLLLATVLTSTSLKSNTFDPDYLEDMVNQIKSDAKLPSATAIAVVRGDKIIYEGYLGFQNIEENQKVSADTRFYIASVTKPFTALNALLDAKKKRVSLDTTMQHMFPDMQLQQRSSVTIADLLTHTASINNLPLVLATAFSGIHSEATLNQIVSQLSQGSSESIGEFKYTNVGYNIYSVYADNLFDEDWQSRLKSNVFLPLGMKNTTARYSDIQDKSLVAKPYSIQSPNRKDALYYIKQDESMHAAGGMYSTARDLARFVIAQVNQGEIDGDQVISPDVIAQSQTRQAQTDKSYLDFNRDGYAWGWYTGNYKDQKMLHHFGGFAGAHAHMSFMPEKKLGLIVLNNEDFLSSRLTAIIADYIYGALLKEEGIGQTLASRIDALSTKLSGLEGMLASQQEKLAARQWLLSLPADNYLGEYHHPLLGSILVSQNDNGRFDVRWGVMHSTSTGMNKADDIRVELEPNSGTVISFNVTDKVNSLTYAGVDFQKRTSAMN